MDFFMKRTRESRLLSLMLGLCLVFGVALLAATVAQAGDGDTVGDAVYHVSLDDSISGGTLTVDPASGPAGTVITVDVAPDSGQRLKEDSLKYTAADGDSYTPIAETEGVYSFTLPAADVEVTARFEDLSTDHTISMTTDYTISAGGTYQIASGSTGIITVSTAEAVTLVGNGIEATGKLQEISIDYTVPNANLTIKDLYIAEPYDPDTVNSVIDFTGTGNKLTLQGTSLLEVADISACIHVGVDTSLTITGEGTLYFYKSGKSAGIGGNGSEYNGDITFDGGKIFGKGSAMGAVIGSGSYMENNINPGSTPGNIRILSGELTLLANARGAAIGQGAGSDSLFTGNVYLSGGLLTVNVDWSGAAIGNGGGSPAPNFTEGGNVYITGGSLRTFIDKNAASGWGYTENGVYPEAITAAKKNLAGETLYLLPFDTSTLATPANEFEVTIDGKPYYEGGLHKYSYVNENSLKYTTDPWVDVTETRSNWGPLEDSKLYFYVNEESHTMAVNGEVFTIPAKALASIAVTSLPANINYAVGETFNPAGMVVTATYTNGETEALTAGAYTISPDAGTPLTLADTKITISYTYKGVTKTAEQAITVLSAPVKNADDVYELSTAGHMLWFASQVNTGLNNAIKGKLMNDIDLSGVAWTPIGKSSTLTYGGSFDGDGKTITLALNSADASGLFGYLNGATVKNLTVAGSITGGPYTAGIAGYATAAAIENCTNNATVTGTAGDVGGIAGYTTGATTVTGCTNNGAVTAAYHVGGIAGRAYGADTIGRCANNGAVTATSTADNASYSVGGIVGYTQVASTVELCHNAGTVKGGVMNVGGVAGYLRNASARLINSYNTGGVISESTIGTAHTGGVIGYTHNASCTVQNTYNAGPVTVSNTGTFTGGVIGYAAGNTNVGDNYYLNITASIGLGYSADNAVSKTSDELKSAAFAALLGAAYMAQDSAYPILAWQGTAGPATYTVTVDGSISGGTVGVNPASGAAGDIITVTGTPDLGKRLVTGSLQYTADGGSTYTPISVTEEVYSFALPAANVEVTARFEDIPAPSLIWDGTSIDTVWYTGAAPGTASYTVTTPNQLAGLAAIVNGTAPGITQSDFAGKTVTLGGNIRLDSSNTKYTAAYGRFGTASYAMESTWYAVYADPLINPVANIWTPIGTGVATGNSAFSSTNFFSGTFDGAGYTVSGLYTNINNTVQGLFGCVGQGGVVKNLTVEGCISGKFIVGGIAAYLNGGTVQNCANKGIVYANGGQEAGSGLENGVSRAGAVGGIVGSMTGTSADPATITGCINYQPVTCTNTAKGGRTGGIVGIIDKATDYGTIANCVNYGAVDGYQYSGGIAGLIASTNVPITNCANAALVSGHSSGHCYVGGIVAQTESNITNCYNTGNYRSAINGNAGNLASNYGGIAGNNGQLGISLITNCYNTGAFVMAGNTTTGSTVGIICGVTKKAGDLVNCYYLDTAVGTINKNDIPTYISVNNARTAAAMQAAPFLAEINGGGRAFVADTAPHLNGGFPILRCQILDSSALTGIVKEADPTTLNYVAGQTFNTAGLLIKANYSDGTSEYITNYTLSIAGELATTDTEITVAGTYGGMAYSFTFDIVVVANELHSISTGIVIKDPDTSYFTGESVQAEIWAYGVENDMTFGSFQGDITYDSAKLTLPSLTPATGFAGNSTYGEGKARVVYSPEGGPLTIPTGGVKIADLVFTVKSGSAPGATEIRFIDADFVVPGSEDIVSAPDTAKTITIYQGAYTLTTSAVGGTVTYTGGTGEGDTTVTTGTDVTFTVAAATGYDIGNAGVSYTVGGGSPVTLMPAAGVYTIPGSAITGNVTVTVIFRVVEPEAVSFLTYDDYKGAPTDMKVLVLTVAEDALPDGSVYKFNGTTDLFYSGAYSGSAGAGHKVYVAFVPVAETAESALNKLSIAPGTLVSIAYNGDVNGKDGIHIQDAQIVYDIYNNSRTEDTSDTIRFAADTDGSRSVDVTDVQKIVNMVLHID